MTEVEDVSPLHIEDAAMAAADQMYFDKRNAKQKWFIGGCALVLGFFAGLGVGAGAFGRKGSKEAESDDASFVVEDTIVVVDFADGVAWDQLNDPVMGGKSTGAFTVVDGVGTMAGSVEIVDFLGAPGFIKAEREGKYPDISSCDAFVLTGRHTDYTSEYGGYRLAFGRARAPADLNPHRWTSGFKAPFTIGMIVDEVTIPFTAFSDDWDDATGDIIVTCAEDVRVCPTSSVLEDIETLSVWGEGVEGAVSLEIHAIKAINCAYDGGSRGR